MRMHDRRAVERSQGRPLGHGPRFIADETATMATALVPLLLATAGLAALGAGLVLTLMPLAFAGAGVMALAFFTFLVMMSMDKADQRRRMQAAARKRQAKEAYRQDVAQGPPRSPLADEAVAALTGEGRGGIWPPLPSRVESGELVMPSQPTTGRPKTADAVSTWEPGARVAPPGWDADVVEFSDVRHEAPRQTVAAGGVTFVDEEVHEALPERGRPATARPDPRPDDRDFRVWPGAKDLDSWTTFTGERRPQASRYSEEDMRKKMDERRQQIAGRLPTVGAILADVSMKESEVDRLRREADRGKCSQCSAIIWAPKKRPIVLKCPGCGHKAKLY